MRTEVCFGLKGSGLRFWIQPLCVPSLIPGACGVWSVIPSVSQSRSRLPFSSTLQLFSRKAFGFPTQGERALICKVWRYRLANFTRISRSNTSYWHRDGPRLVNPSKGRLSLRKQSKTEVHLVPGHINAIYMGGLLWHINARGGGWAPCWKPACSQHRLTEHNLEM